jgi:hypothetical protein
MKSVTIPIHSFVDLITNSSSEIFVSANERTVKLIEELINHLLKGAGSTKTSNDLFSIAVSDGSLTIVPKEASADLAIAATILSNITDIFSIDAQYNG